MTILLTVSVRDGVTAMCEGSERGQIVAGTKHDLMLIDMPTHTVQHLNGHTQEHAAIISVKRGEGGSFLSCGGRQCKVWDTRTQSCSITIEDTYDISDACFMHHYYIASVSPSSK